MILSWSHAAILRSALDRLILRIPDIDYRLVDKDEKKFLVNDILLLQTSFPSWLWQISGPAPGSEVGDVSIPPRAMATDRRMSPVQVLGFYSSATTASSMFHSAIVCARRSCALALWFKFVCSVRPARAITLACPWLLLGRLSVWPEPWFSRSFPFCCCCSRKAKFFSGIVIIT